VIDRVPRLGPRAAYARQAIDNALVEHRRYIAKRGEDLPAVLSWKWGRKRTARAQGSSTEADKRRMLSGQPSRHTGFTEWRSVRPCLPFRICKRKTDLVAAAFNGPPFDLCRERSTRRKARDEYLVLPGPAASF
jgi:hypothetical protein